MPANLRVADDTRDAILNSVRDLIDAGAGAGTIRFYDNPQPADADDAITTQTLLAELAFADPSAPNASAGTLTFNAITDDASANATGTASWARIVDSNGNNIFDCNVGTSSATIILNTTSIVAGGPVEITSFVLNMPAG